MGIMGKRALIIILMILVVGSTSCKKKPTASNTLPPPESGNEATDPRDEQPLEASEITGYQVIIPAETPETITYSGVSN